MELTGAQIIAECLLEQRVDTVFGYPGGAVLNIYDALYEYRDRIRHVLTAHEQGAAHAADGYARSTGKAGVVIATSGPGATNLVTGIATAYMDSIPMVAITGNVAVEPVSYTHLDVYKRQAVGREAAVGWFAGLDLDTIGTAVFLNVILQFNVVVLLHENGPKEMSHNTPPLFCFFL